MLGPFCSRPAIPAVDGRPLRWAPFGCLVVMTGPSITEVVASRAPPVDVPGEGAPVGLGQYFAKIDTKETLDSTKYDFGRHCLKINVESNQVALKIEHWHSCGAIFAQKLMYGRT